MLRRAFLWVPAAPVVRGHLPQPAMFGDAEAYERFMGRWSRLVAPRLVDFSGLPQSGRILDVGSGTGSLSFAIAERRPRIQIVGIDPSREYVGFATSRSSFADRATFEVGDAQQLRFPPAAFDAALSLLVFNFIPDPAKALAELRRVVKPRGLITAAVWDYGSGMRMLRTFWDAVVQIDPGAENSDEKRMPLCRAGELAALWRKAGLADVLEQPIDIEMRFESFPDYWEPFLLGQGPAGAYIRRANRDRVDALREELRRRLAPADKPFTLPARVWAVRGSNPGS